MLPILQQDRKRFTPKNIYVEDALSGVQLAEVASIPDLHVQYNEYATITTVRNDRMPHN